jgi:hypothetical protein
MFTGAVAFLIIGSLLAVLSPLWIKSSRNLLLS